MILYSFRCHYENKLQIVVTCFIQWPFDIYIIYASTHYNSKGNQKEIMTIGAVPWIITRFRLLLFTLMVPAHLIVQHRGNFPSAITEADSRKEFFLWSEFTVITSTMSWDAASFFSNAKLLSSAKSKCGPLISSKTGCIAVLDLERQMFALVFLVSKCLLSEPRQEFSAWKTETERIRSDLQQMASPT